MQYDVPVFDPTSVRCKLQLADKLGVAQNARIERLNGISGGQNHGVWRLSDSSKILVLKLVRNQRNHPMIPTEGENFVKLAREYPRLVHDRDIAFPLKIFRCRGPSGNNTHDLIVMMEAPGECFTNVINSKWPRRKGSELMNNFEALGSFLANVHKKYGLEHGDFQPSNIFYDEASDHFTMIDVADLSLPGSPFGCQEPDVEHFCSGVRLLARCHGEQFRAEGVRRFKAGYTKCRQSPR